MKMKGPIESDQHQVKGKGGSSIVDDGVGGNEGEGVRDGDR